MTTRESPGKSTTIFPAKSNNRIPFVLTMYYRFHTRMPTKHASPELRTMYFLRIHHSLYVYIEHTVSFSAWKFAFRNINLIFFTPFRCHSLSHRSDCWIWQSNLMIKPLFLVLRSIDSWWSKRRYFAWITITGTYSSCLIIIPGVL